MKEKILKVLAWIAFILVGVLMFIGSAIVIALVIDIVMTNDLWGVIAIAVFIGFGLWCFTYLSDHGYI